MTKLCVNCKHVVLPKLHDNNETSRCGYKHPISLVTGLLVPDDKLPYCAVQRLNHEPCKIAGDLWEAADHVMTPEEEEQMLKEAKYV
jgi:hypothetical protein